MKPNLYGKYAGKLEREVNYLQNCSELELFIQVNSYCNPIYSCNENINTLEYFKKVRDFYHNTGEVELEEYFNKRIIELTKTIKDNKKDFNSDEWAYPMDYCILQTARFGTKVTYNPNGRVILTEEFNEWYNNWKAYLEYMDSETLAYYRVCRYEGKGLDKFHLDRPIEKEIITKEIDSIKPYTYQLTKKSTEQKLA